MAANDEDESTAVIVGVLAGIVLAIVAVAYGANAGKNVQAAAKPIVEHGEIAPVGEALAKVYFNVGAAVLKDADKDIAARTLEALRANDKAIVLLSGFHDSSGDPAQNAQLAKHRAQTVRDALVAGGVAAERIKFRKPESTVGAGRPEEGRRVEIRVQ